LDGKNDTGNMEVIIDNAQLIEKEIEWFEKLAHTSLTLYFNNESEVESIWDHIPPSVEDDESQYGTLVKEHDLNFEQRLILILALMPHLKPQALDVFLIKNQNLNSEFSEFGGYKDSKRLGFNPTLETACFILAGNDLEHRMRCMKMFNRNSVLFRKGILRYSSDQSFNLSEPLTISNEYFGLLINGKKQLPEYSMSFPAKEISTQMEWEDLIVNDNVASSLLEIKDWLYHSELILHKWELHKNLKKGYRVLFYGSPGTGKTLAATLLGKETERPVFRVDLSLVVSKYIGETEKNLGRLFDEAENKKWILFFDEADALFSKRTSTNSSNDRHANQEVAYLLQRIEDFSGLVILATNLHGNIDEAFGRRFQSTIHFPKPGVKQRKRLWERLFSAMFKMGEGVQLDELASSYELTGGEMINVLRYCALEAARRNEKKIELNDILKGIRREYRKQNKTL